MRWFLIFLAVAFPVVLADPSFRSLWKMEFGAERIGYGRENGVTQWATIGPKAPWPAWALVPGGAKLTVRANFEPAPGHDAIGYGDIAGNESARLTTLRYENSLRRAGWTIRVGRYGAALPEVPPRAIHWCIVEARRGERVQRLSVDIDETRTAGSLYWSEGDMRFPIGATDEPCWSAQTKRR